MALLDRSFLRRLAVAAPLATLLLAALVLLLQVLRVGYHLRGADLVPLLFAALPSVAGFALPFAVAAAIVECYGHLQATNQLEAMRLCGASTARLARPALLLVLGALALSLGLARLEPQALERLSRELITRAAASLLEPGRFLSIGDGRTFYARARDRATGELRGVLVARPGSVLLAQSARVQLPSVSAGAGAQSARGAGRVRVELRGAELHQALPAGRATPVAATRLRRVRFERLLFEIDLGPAVAPHLGFVARVLAAPRRLASPPLSVVALGLLACVAALRSRSRLRAAVWLVLVGGAFVAADLALAALTPSLWPPIALVAVIGCATALALRR